MTLAMLDTIPRRAVVRELTDETHLYLPTDPYGEGQRARAAGLTGDNPYRLWPCVAAQWAAGWSGEAR